MGHERSDRWHDFTDTLCCSAFFIKSGYTPQTLPTHLSHFVMASGNLSWKESVALSHARWDRRPPPIMAARLLPALSSRAALPQPQPARDRLLMGVKPQVDDSPPPRAIDVHAQRIRGLTKSSSDPIIARLQRERVLQSEIQEPRGLVGVTARVDMEATRRANRFESGLVLVPRRTRGQPCSSRGQPSSGARPASAAHTPRAGKPQRIAAH